MGGTWSASARGGEREGARAPKHDSIRRWVERAGPEARRAPDVVVTLRWTTPVRETHAGAGDPHLPNTFRGTDARRGSRVRRITDAMDTRARGQEARDVWSMRGRARTECWTHGPRSYGWTRVVAP